MDQNAPPKVVPSDAVIAGLRELLSNAHLEIVQLRVLLNQQEEELTSLRFATDGKQEG